jgi:flagellin-like protein
VIVVKANQKFLRDDDGVSPVIAVILMVAITVVLAATVYVWVSGFGAQSGSPARSLSLTSGGAKYTDTNGNDWKNYTVSSATSGLRWSDIKFTLNGVQLACSTTFATTATTFGVSQGGGLYACGASGSPLPGPSTVIGAGDRFQLFVGATGSPAAPAAGQTLRVLDANANSVILSIVVG